MAISSAIRNLRFKMAKIDILTNDGSPLGVHLEDVYGDGERIGVGGSELYLLTLCEMWHQAGHEVTLYNDPTKKASPFAQRQISDFVPEGERDVLIIFRSPNEKALTAKGKKVWLSCDQYTVGNFSEFAKRVDEVVLISPTHRQHFAEHYGIFDSRVIDIPVRVSDYQQTVEKRPFQCLFCSIPDRGLGLLSIAWPLIKQKVPEATLKITSGWTLWDGKPDEQRLAPYRQAFAGDGSVEYLGALKRREMVRVQQESQVLAYPCTFPELFCISVAECQVAGVIPVTSNLAALATTNMGVLVNGLPYTMEWVETFAESVVATLLDPQLADKQEALQKRATERFDLPTILKKWDKIIL